MMKRWDWSKAVSGQCFLEMALKFRNLGKSCLKIKPRCDSFEIWTFVCLGICLGFLNFSVFQPVSSKLQLHHQGCPHKSEQCISPFIATIRTFHQWHLLQFSWLIFAKIATFPEHNILPVKQMIVFCLHLSSHNLNLQS